MRSNYGQKKLLVAVQSGKGHIGFTRPFLLKMGCEVSDWKFLKFLFFCAGFYCILRLLVPWKLLQRLFYCFSCSLIG